VVIAPAPAAAPTAAPEAGSPAQKATPPEEPAKVAVAEPRHHAAADDEAEANVKDDAPAPDEPGDAPNKADKKKAAPKQHHKVVAPTTVAVTFKTDPEGARVAARDHVYGTTPQPVKLTPGTAYDLTFTKAGYAPASKKYVAPAAAKGPQTLHVSLKKVAEPKKAPPPQPSHKGWFSR